MLQHNWTIHQGNVPRLSVWPRLWPGHPLSFSALLKLALSVSRWHSVCLSLCVRYRELLGYLHRGMNAGSCSYFGEVFVVALLAALKVVLH